MRRRVDQVAKKAGREPGDPRGTRKRHPLQPADFKEVERVSECVGDNGARQHTVQAAPIEEAVEHVVEEVLGEVARSIAALARFADKNEHEQHDQYGAGLERREREGAEVQPCRQLRESAYQRTSLTS